MTYVPWCNESSWMTGKFLVHINCLCVGNDGPYFGSLHLITDVVTKDERRWNNAPSWEVCTILGIISSNNRISLSKSKRGNVMVMLSPRTLPLFCINVTSIHYCITLYSQLATVGLSLHATTYSSYSGPLVRTLRSTTVGSRPRIHALICAF